MFAAVARELKVIVRVSPGQSFIVEVTSTVLPAPKVPVHVPEVDDVTVTGPESVN